MKKIFAAAFAALAVSGAAHADVPGPRCDVGGTAAVFGVCGFGHPSFTSLSVSASATGVPGLTSVHITLRHFDASGIGAVALECSDTSDDLADPTAACSATIPYSGAGAFVCQIEGSVQYVGTCDSTVAG